MLHMRLAEKGGIVMKSMRRLLFVSLCLGMWGIALAQDETCPAIVETALDNTDKICTEAGRNQACYGHVALTAEAQPGIEDFVFDAAGDIVNVGTVQTMALSPMDEENGTWGVVLMRLQANLPDTMPGQNVTFLLFGDVEITNAVEDDSDLNPMQAFYLKTGIGDSQCEEAPESGLLVQTPDGAGEIAFTVNEVNVTMGSTVYFQANPEHEEMIVNTLEGRAILERAGRIQTILAGTRLRIPIIFDGDRIRALDLPDLLEPYDKRLLDRLPLILLKRRIEVERPLTLAEIRELRNLLESGDELCGIGRLPACEDDRLPLATVLPNLPSLPRLPGQRK
jgi:hypothetical protein